MADTKTRILDSAEVLFAERGVEATSLRAVTTKAESNLAAVHYHFGSKEALIAAVVGRRLSPVNEERLRELEKLNEKSSKPASLEELLEAYFKPAISTLDNSEQGPLLAKMMSRLFWESGGETRQLIVEQFSEVWEGFIRALRKALPELSTRQVISRFHFGIGVLIQSLSQRGYEEDPKMPSILEKDPERQLAVLVAFVAAGFRAQVPEKKK
ncbi:TetR/AcrR family transcriptional regulator, partial [Myxococcota bacterium]|nr:TetR/AcrR family transcriptional regulator [Myxococcota bacterium]